MSKLLSWLGGSVLVAGAGYYLYKMGKASATTDPATVAPATKVTKLLNASGAPVDTSKFVRTQPEDTALMKTFEMSRFFADSNKVLRLVPTPQVFEGARPMLPGGVASTVDNGIDATILLYLASKAGKEIRKTTRCATAPGNYQPPCTVAYKVVEGGSAAEPGWVTLFAPGEASATVDAVRVPDTSTWTAVVPVAAVGVGPAPVPVASPGGPGIMGPPPPPNPLPPMPGLGLPGLVPLLPNVTTLPALPVQPLNIAPPAQPEPSTLSPEELEADVRLFTLVQPATEPAVGDTFKVTALVRRSNRMFGPTAVAISNLPDGVVLLSGSNPWGIGPSKGDDAMDYTFRLDKEAAGPISFAFQSTKADGSPVTAAPGYWLGGGPLGV